MTSRIQFNDPTNFADSSRGGQQQQQNIAAIDDNSLVNMLMARYGQDPNASTRQLPKNRGATVVTPSNAATANTLWWTPESDEDLNSIQRPVHAGGAYLSQIILQHLRSSGLGDVAAVFAQELKSATVSPEYFDILKAPLQLPQPNLSQASALTHLVCPLAATRSQAKELLSTGAQVFTASIEGSNHDQMTLHNLFSQYEEPMWSDACSPTWRHRIYSRPDTGALRAAPINSMMEQLTSVHIRPHVTESDEKLRAAANFRRKFFATHRHFVPSRVVLAKLFHRFIVPCSLPLALQYEAHGILIDCHPKTYNCDVQAVPLMPALGQPLASTTAEAQDNAVWLDLYSRVTKAIQIKVLGVISEWLTMFPDHFDSAMEEALITFVHEACGSPAIPWANCPVELEQGAEKIKLLLAEQNAAIVAAAANRNSRISRASTTGAEHISNRKRRNIGAPNAEFDIEVATAMTEGAAGKVPKSLMVKWTLANLDEAKLANQITTIDHFLLRRITPSELFAQSTDIGTRGHSNSAMRAASSNVHAFLKRGEELMRWLLCEIIWGGGGGGGDSATNTSVNASDQADDFDPDVVPQIVDETGRAYVREIEKRVQLIQKTVALAFRLIELNNLHSAFAVYLVLRHPSLLRLYDVWRNVPRDVNDNIAELRELFNFEKGYRMYRDYLSSMSDDDLYPLIPVLQVSVDELRRIEREPTVLLDSNGGPVVHWRKYDVIGSLYSRFMIVKESIVPAEFVAVPACISWLEFKLNKARQADFETIVKASLKAQPSRKMK